MESCSLTGMEGVDAQLFKPGKWESHDPSLVYMASSFTKQHKEWLLMFAIGSIRLTEA